MTAVGGSRAMAIVTLSLEPETERKLRDKADHAGLTLEELLSQLADEAARGTDRTQRTFDEILAPVRNGFADCGKSEAELTAEFEAARDEVWQSGQNRKSSP
jgi:hypothetical protein